MPGKTEKGAGGATAPPMIFRRGITLSKIILHVVQFAFTFRMIDMDKYISHNCKFCQENTINIH